MGYFADDTEAELFVEKYCYKCRNWRINGCAIIDIHRYYGYQLSNSKSIAKKILDYFIQNDGVKIDKWSCRMFLKRAK